MDALRSGQVVVDVGGGKQPLISAEQKHAFGLTVIGFDISAAELGAAPAGRYDECICADITDFRGTAQADIVICQALLEHVTSTERAFRTIGSLLKPGGLALIFAPSRNAVFARLNLLLPQRLKRAILFAVFPESRHAQGFVSYYDRCTPRDFESDGPGSEPGGRGAPFFFPEHLFHLFRSVARFVALVGSTIQGLAARAGRGNFRVCLPQARRRRGREIECR